MSKHLLDLQKANLYSFQSYINLFRMFNCVTFFDTLSRPHKPYIIIYIVFIINIT
jgi:hypothetical protein